MGEVKKGVEEGLGDMDVARRTWGDEETERGGEEAARGSRMILFLSLPPSLPPLVSFGAFRGDIEVVERTKRGAVGTVRGGDDE